MSKSAFGAAVIDKVRNVIRDCHGNLSIIFALLLPLVAFCCGMAIDYGRATFYASRLQSSADAAVLAAVTASRNGLDVGTVSALANEVFNANLGVNSGSTGAANIQVQQSGQGVTASLEVAGKVPTSITKIFDFDNLSITAASSARAQMGAIGTASVGKLNGQGYVWGDPHFGMVGATEYTIGCDSNQWYVALADGGLQWNAKCADITNTVWSIIYTAHKIFVGSHVITYEALPDTSATIDADKFDDDVVPGAITIPNGSAWPAKITVDDVAYNPTGSGSIVELVNDVANGITVTVQTSAHTIPAAFGTVSGSYHNFLSLTIKTPNYTIIMAQPQGYSWDDISVTNGGMCGDAGGIWGKLLTGTPDLDPAHFRLSGPDEKLVQFRWTPTCPAGAAGVAFLVK